MIILPNTSARVPVRLLKPDSTPKLSVLPASISNGTLTHVTFTRGDGSTVDIILVNGVNWFEIDPTYAPGLYHLLIPSSATDIEGAWQLSVVASPSTLFQTTHNTGSIESPEIVTPYPDQSQFSGTEETIKFAESFAFPFRFGYDGDVIKSHDEKTIEDNIKSSVMILKYGIPLRSKLGSLLPLLPFDPNDQVLREQIIDSIESAVAIGEPRAQVDSSIRFIKSLDTNTLSLVTPYKVKSTSKNWKNLRLTEKDIVTVG